MSESTQPNPSELFEPMEMERSAPSRFQWFFNIRWSIVGLTLLVLCAIFSACYVGKYLNTCLIGGPKTVAASWHSCTNASVPNILDKNDTKVSYKKVAVRLPPWPKPIHYDLRLIPNLQPSHLNYTANVSILIASGPNHNQNQILLHSAYLNVTSVKLWKVSNKLITEFERNSSVLSLNTPNLPRLTHFNVEDSVSIDTYDFDQQNETMLIKLTSNLLPHSAYRLDIAFDAKISSMLSGFYRSTYRNSTTGNISYLGMTQFQATDARRAFPCWDEPAFKATFDITIVHWQNHTVLSNMPPAAVIPLPQAKDNWTVTRFQRTLRMSTYLLAWAVGELKALKSNETSFAIWSRPAVIYSAEHALKLGPEVLQFYEKFFGISYPLPKTDMLAAPDFNAGAMENWGLITYRETLLLYEPNVSRPLDLYAVSSVVAHELAHQWFGNLVTMRWWDDLWLNEGFATYLSYEALEALYPQWQVMHDLLLSETQSVLRVDCLRSSHPISVAVDHPDEISEIFDYISYSKGASIIRMMVHFLGRDKFRAGVSAYLKALAFSNSRQDDLWHYLSLAAKGDVTVPDKPIIPIFNKSIFAKNHNSSDMIMINDEPDVYPQSSISANDTQKLDHMNNLNVKTVMDSWTLKPGYPIIIVNRNYTDNSGQFYQERFLLEKSNESYTGDLWDVPITYTTKSDLNWNATTRFWLHHTDRENDTNSVYTIDNLAGPKEWLLVNVKQIGFYRVNYDKRNWELLIQQLVEHAQAIEEQSRAQIISDMFALAEADYIPYELPLNTCLEYLRYETSPLVWRSALSGLSQISVQLQRSPLFGKWCQYIREVMTLLYEEHLSFDDSKVRKLQDAELQAAGLQFSCRHRVGDCRRKAQQLFYQWMRMRNQSSDRNVQSDHVEPSNPIAPNVRLIVYCVGVQEGDLEEWEFVWEEYKRTQVASERIRLLHSLKCTRIPWLLVRLLHSAFAESGSVKKQDGISLFRSVASQDYARDIAFNYLRQNWILILARFGKSFFSFGRLIASISTVNTQSELDQMLDFHHLVRPFLGSAERAFQQAIESIQANIRWMRLFHPQVQTFLFSKYGELTL